MARLTLISLLLVTMMVSAATAQGGISNCCRKLSDTQVNREWLKSYYKQKPPTCQLHAIVFTTIKGKRICADSKKLWTQTSMAFLDGKNWHKKTSQSRQ